MKRGATIGFDVTAALTQGGGIGRYTRELIHALVSAAPQYRYTLFSARPPAAPPVPDSLPAAAHVAHRPAPVDERWLYRLWYRANLPLPVQFFTGPIDLFHSPDFVLPPVRGDIPTLLTVHDLSFIHYPETFPARLVVYLNRVVPRSVARAGHILADSQATRRDLEAVWGVSPGKVTVLYSGVNPRFRPVRDLAALAAVRARYGLGNRPYVLTVGTVQPRKNYEMLVRAFAPLAERHPHTLVIAGGRGWLVEGLLAEIARLGLGDRVQLAGFVDDADLPALYSAADLFVFPSLYEGFGLPLLEAMACGAPVVTSDASSLPEVVRTDGAAAALALSPHDEAGWTAAMDRLLSDEVARRALAAAGPVQAARFSWERAAGELADLYATLLADLRGLPQTSEV
ncbi:glycosyltransferase family 4 protein [Promineifilum sp.]|uniref:glycosyltransferase family 4 protein n=1 Tax=Promineifilum sp. TaxID=2664178 RepID=UPI0035AEBC9F